MMDDPIDAFVYIHNHFHCDIMAPILRLPLCLSGFKSLKGKNMRKNKFIVGRANPPLLAALLKVNLESIRQPNFDSFCQTFIFFFFSTFFLLLYRLDKSCTTAKLGRTLSFIVWVTSNPPYEYNKKRTLGLLLQNSINPFILRLSTLRLQLPNSILFSVVFQRHTAIKIKLK